MTPAPCRRPNLATAWAHARPRIHQSEDEDVLVDLPQPMAAVKLVLHPTTRSKPA